MRRKDDAKACVAEEVTERFAALRKEMGSGVDSSSIETSNRRRSVPPPETHRLIFPGSNLLIN